MATDDTEHGTASAPDRLAEVLARRFGLTAFRPGQRSLIEAVLQGRDVLGVLPTGGGKSLCYQLPAALLPGVAVVITPLVSLIEDQVVRARAVGLQAAGLSGLRRASENQAALEAAQQRRLDLLFLAPERLRARPVRVLLRGGAPSLIVVDEAHCISLWGMDFRPSYRVIGDALRPRRVPLIALTATAAPEVRADILGVLRMVDPVVRVSSFDRPELFWSVQHVRGLAAKARALMDAIRQHGGARLVYAATRRSVRVLHARFAGCGWGCRPYHAGLPASVRSDTQRWFTEARAPVLVATNAFGMGIDRSDVRLVAHESLPLSLEAYYQEAGRAGRDGRSAQVLALDDPKDRARRRALLNRSRPHRDVVSRAHSILMRGLGPGGAVHAGRLEKCLPRSLVDQAEPLIRCLELAGGVGAVDGDPSLRLLPGPLDLAPVQRRHRAGLRGIRAVERFARSRRCRRRTLLGFFGEPAPRRCQACDRCVGRATAAQDA